MRVLLQLDDDLVDVYKALAGRKPLEKALSDQLVRFQTFGPTDVAMILTPQQLGILDQLLGVGATVDAAHLLHAIRTLASLDIGVISIPVAPKQWDAVKARAEKQGRSLELVCKDAAERILNEIAGY